MEATSPSLAEQEAYASIKHSFTRVDLIPPGAGGEGGPHTDGDSFHVSVEKPLLATAIAYKTVAFDVLDRLKSEDFNYRLCRDVYDALNDLYRLGKPIDMLTVYETMKAKPHCSYVNLILLTQFCQEVTVPSFTDSYIDVIKKHSATRKLHELLGDLASKISRKVDPNIILENIKDTVDKIEKTHSAASESTLRELRTLELERIRDERKILKDGENLIIKGILTGYAELDQKYLGWNPGELHIVAARPGIGKTSFALNLLKRICLDRSHKGLFFSLEMTSQHICRRTLSICHRIAFWRLSSSAITDEQFHDLESSDKVENSVVSIFDFDCVDFSNLRRESKRIKDSRGLDIIFVDYIQLMRASGKKSFENRHTEVSEITRGLKLLAKELSVPIVALSQLSRNVNENERPALRDLKESGSIEQDADSVMLMYRPVPATPQIGEKQSDNCINCINIDIAKNRNGPTGIVQLTQHPEFFIFDNIAKESESWLYSVNSNIFKKVVE